MASPRVASDAVQAGLGPAGGAGRRGGDRDERARHGGHLQLTTPRVYWAMAERGLFFRGVAELHPRWRTPVRAIAPADGVGRVLVLAWGTFESLVSYVLFVDWIFFGLTGAAVFVLRRRRGAPEAYRVPVYPLVPLAFVGVSAWFLASTLWGQPRQAIAGTVLLALGVPVHRAWRHRQQQREARNLALQPVAVMFLGRIDCRVRLALWASTRVTSSRPLAARAPRAPARRRSPAQSTRGCAPPPRTPWAG